MNPVVQSGRLRLLRYMAKRLPLAPPTGAHIAPRQRGLRKKTEPLLLGELDERLGDAVVGLTIVIEQIVLNDQVPVVVKQRRAVRGLPVNLVARVILRRLAHRSEEDRVIFLLRTQRPNLRIIVPLLHEQHAGLGAGVRLEDVAVQADDSEDATMRGKIFAQVLVTSIVEAPLRQNNGHPPAGLEEGQIAFDEQNIAPDGVLVLDLDLAIGAVGHLINGLMAGVQCLGEAGRAFAGIDNVGVGRIDLGNLVVAHAAGQFVLCKDAGFLDVAGEGRISHQHVKTKIAVTRLVSTQLAQALPAFAVDIGPFLVTGLFIPPLIIQRVKVKHVGLSVASNQVEGTSDTNGFLIEVDGENLVADIVLTTGRFLLGS